MIALDTNIIIRFLVRDDPKQAELARQRLKQAEARAPADSAGRGAGDDLGA